MGYTRGQPDLMIANPNREYNGLAIEFKHPGYEPAPSEEQISFHTRLRNLGWKVIVCNDYTAGIRAVDEYMKTCKVMCECCLRMFPRKRKHEAEENAAAHEEVL